MRTAQVAAALGAAILIGAAACGTRPPASHPPVAEPALPTAEPTAGSARLPRVSGRLKTPDGRRLLSAAMILVPLDPGAPPGAGDARVQPDGTFMFLNVPPGRYQVRARGETEAGGTPLLATFRLVVAERDVTNLHLELGPGAEVTGTLQVHGRGHHRPSFTGVRVRAPFADGSSFGDAVTGEIAADGSFTIRGLMNGMHVIALEGLPDPWVLQSVEHGGRDITDRGIDVEAGQRVADVTVVVTDVASEISGRVTDAAGAPAAGALVVFVPSVPEFWTLSSGRLRAVRTDESGRYRVRGLPVGEYLVTASRDRQEADIHQPEVLRELSARGTPFTMPSSGALDLVVQAPDAVRAAAPR